MLDVDKKVEEIESKQTKCEHYWEFVDVFNSTFKMPYYHCLDCGKVRFIDFDENGNIKN